MNLQKHNMMRKDIINMVTILIELIEHDLMKNE